MTATPPRTTYDAAHGLRHEFEAFDSDDDRGIGEIVKDLSVHAQQLVRAEIDLAKDELANRAKAMAVYVGLAVGGGFLALLSLVFLGHALANLLDLAIPEWTAYLLTWALLMAAAGTLAFLAKQGFEKTSVAPKDSIEHAKEDVAWVKRHM